MYAVEVVVVVVESHWGSSKGFSSPVLLFFWSGFPEKKIMIILFQSFSLIKESQYFTSRLFTTCFIMRHDTIRCGNQNVTKLTRG